MVNVNSKNIVYTVFYSFFVQKILYIQFVSLQIFRAKRENFEFFYCIYSVFWKVLFRLDHVKIHLKYYDTTPEFSKEKKVHAFLFGILAASAHCRSHVFLWRERFWYFENLFWRLMKIMYTAFCMKKKMNHTLLTIISTFVFPFEFLKIKEQMFFSIQFKFKCTSFFNPQENERSILFVFQRRGSLGSHFLLSFYCIYSV